MECTLSFAKNASLEQLKKELRKHGITFKESPHAFFIQEEQRLKEIRLDYPNHKALKKITPTSFLNSQFVSPQEKAYIISSDSVSVKDIIEISNNVLKRFKHWYLEKLLKELSSIFNMQVTKDSLYSSIYLNMLADENPENGYIIFWWKEEGEVFIKQLNIFPVPCTLAGLHDGILLCGYFSKSTAYDSEIEKLFSIAELFIWEWRLLEERHYCCNLY